MNSLIDCFRKSWIQDNERECGGDRQGRPRRAVDLANLHALDRTVRQYSICLQRVQVICVAEVVALCDPTTHFCAIDNAAPRPNQGQEKLLWMGGVRSRPAVAFLNSFNIEGSLGRTATEHWCACVLLSTLWYQVCGFSRVSIIMASAEARPDGLSKVKAEKMLSISSATASTDAG